MQAFRRFGELSTIFTRISRMISFQIFFNAFSDLCFSSIVRANNSFSQILIAFHFISIKNKFRIHIWVIDGHSVLQCHQTVKKHFFSLHYKNRQYNFSYNCGSHGLFVQLFFVQTLFVHHFVHSPFVHHVSHSTLTIIFRMNFSLY